MKCGSLNFLILEIYFITTKYYGFWDEKIFCDRVHQGSIMVCKISGVGVSRSHDTKTKTIQQLRENSNCLFF